MTVKSNKNAAQGACYVAPKAVELDLRSEGVLCGSYIYHFGGGGTYGDWDINDNGEY